ncbi:MAG: SH3 domain-containing protein [Benniella sp.]|nr:MAG: SH3 domain-containing protein [Benniella sp.]
MVDLDVARIDGPNEDQAKPREQYAKHTGCFADAAPRMAHSTGGGNDGLLGTNSTSVEANRADPVKNGILNPETLEAAPVTSPQETSLSPTPENSNGQFGISEVPDLPVIARVQASYDYKGPDEGYLSFEAGDIINVIEFLDNVWWHGIRGKDVGYFPVAYVRELPSFGHPTLGSQPYQIRPEARPSPPPAPLLGHARLPSPSGTGVFPAPSTSTQPYDYFPDTEDQPSMMSMIARNAMNANSSPLQYMYEMGEDLPFPSTHGRSTQGMLLLEPFQPSFEQEQPGSGLGQPIPYQ